MGGLLLVVGFLLVVVLVLVVARALVAAFGLGPWSCRTVDCSIIQSAILFVLHKERKPFHFSVVYFIKSL